MLNLHANNRCCRRARRLFLTALAALTALGGIVQYSFADESNPPEPPQFERDIQPLFKTYCWKCHGGEGYAAQLDLRSQPLALKGSQTGAVIEPGSSEKSKLYQKLAAGEMPPGKELKPTAEHIAAIKAWIDAGAPARYSGAPLGDSEIPPLTKEDREWWAFRKPVRPNIPAVQHEGDVRTPIDSFLLAALEARGLGFAPESDRSVLLRRVYFDILGLPPTPGDREAFLSDTDTNAYEKLIDRLLESPHYGERWGRHWLDAAGFVDTLGTDNDAGIIELLEGNWRYRDYVVKSLNADKPYDRFLVEQIAGDELVDWRNATTYTPETTELLVATSFLRQGSDVTYAPELNTADIRNQVIYDTIQSICTNVLGLTLHCAQCHSHKFDPLSHADYYAFRGLLAPAFNVQKWTHSKDRFLPDVAPPELAAITAHNAELDKKLAELNQQIAAIRQPFEQKLLEEKLATLPEAIRADTQAAVGTPAEKRNEVQKYLAEKFASLLMVKPEDVATALDAPAKQSIAEKHKLQGELQATRKSFGKIPALWDVAAAPANYLHRRGAYENPGPEVPPAVPAILNDPQNPFVIPAPAAGAPTSGFRTALARWLARPDHPLTSRVIVNRVWQQYFGRGLVATPDNFGRSGAMPSHPELLDWLATDFVREGWTFKRLHKLILMSRAYRQQTAAANDERAAAARRIDSDNHLLWQMPLRRLESEIIRDEALAVSGRLDRTIGGLPIPIKPLPDGMIVIETEKVPAGKSPFRRSMYLVSRRNYQPTELSVFDQPLIAVNCTRRTSAAVALQSLTMLNSQFILEQADQFSRRVLAAAGPDETRQIEQAFVLALSRSPSHEEIALSRELLASQRKRALEQSSATPSNPAATMDDPLVHLCHMLLNSNEFLYVP